MELAALNVNSGAANSHRRHRAVCDADPRAYPTRPAHFTALLDHPSMFAVGKPFTERDLTRQRRGRRPCRRIFYDPGIRREHTRMIGRIRRHAALGIKKNANNIVEAKSIERSAVHACFRNLVERRVRINVVNASPTAPRIMRCAINGARREREGGLD